MQPVVTNAISKLQKYGQSIKQKAKKPASDSDDTEDVFDRYIFAEEIYNKITQEHSESSSSYIFGISGYWGEGKTHLLHILERKLKENKYNVVWFSPWKYARDRAALMRCFIRLINKQLPRFFMPWNMRVNLNDFERDQNVISLSLWWTIVASLGLGTIFFLLHAIPGFKKILNDNESLVILIVIPLVVAVLSKLGTFQKTTKATSAVDQFDDRLNIILNRVKRCNKKIIIFVDDLDRASEEEASGIVA